MTSAHILIIDDNKSILSALDLLLRFEYDAVDSISNPNQIPSLELDRYDVVLLDMNFSAGVNTGNEGLYWLREIKKRSPQTTVVMMTAYGAVDLAVSSLKEGAADFILKPWNNEKLLATVRAALELSRSHKTIDELKRKEGQLKQVINEDRHSIVGQSEAIEAVLKLTRKVAATEVNVLITGENGTGKELIARELHRASNRRDEVFIKVDMGSIAENLLESELFGHVRGAFTDAREDRTGKFEAAHKGTLFLDEIGNLSLQAQSKLLTAIQSKSIVKVGSNKSITVDIRLLCATNCNLEQMVREGAFREDLLYRINTITIEVPPLRERGEDIRVLADFFLRKFSAKYDKTGIRLSNAAQQKLVKYSWPGNIRELLHSVERAVILAEDNSIEPEDISLGTAGQRESPSANAPKTLEEMEVDMIRKALDRHQGNYTAAAEELGITRQTLYNKLKKFAR